ncbi:MAG TPA: flagellar motor protein MotB [Bryobacteraceae bacterium]|jgi:chemotaxis protein MotB
MARRKSAARENHDRWLVSYADLVTLLFAFFVVMFASTQTDKTRAKQISEAVQKALHEGSTPPKVAAILGGTVDDKGRGNAMLRGPALSQPEKTPELAAFPHALNLAAAGELLRSKLAREIEQGSVEVHVEERGIIIGLNAAVFFPSGGDTIDERVYPTTAKVAAVLNQLPNALRLEGHTDSLPINNARFRSNWELSAARSIAMLRLLNERYGVDRRRMAVVGYADTLSADSNDTEAGRRKNRRVDIVIVSDFGMRAEPGQPPPAPTADKGGP